MTMVERTDYEKWSSVADRRDNGSHITTNKITKIHVHIHSVIYFS